MIPVHILWNTFNKACKNKKTAPINRAVFIKVCDIILEHESC